MNQLDNFRPDLSRMGIRQQHPDDLIPTTVPVGQTVLRCSCGLVSRVDSKVLIRDGWECPCGHWKIPGRGDPCRPNPKRRRGWNRRGQ
jgi:hypothetical protein